MENLFIFCRMFGDEVEKARLLNIKLSFGIGVFQGFSNMFINGIVLGVLYAGKWMLIKYFLIDSKHNNLFKVVKCL